MLGKKELWRIFENQDQPHLTRLPLQGYLMEYDLSSESVKRMLTQFDRERAAKVAKRLLGPPKLPAGTYKMIHAEGHLSTGDIVFLSSFEKARKCTGNEMPSGIALGTITKGSYGWMQITS
jgi:hypothetical protein